MILIDTHTHLYSEEFDSDRFDVVKRALDQKVDKLLLPNIDSSSIQALLKLESDFPNHCYAMMGLHPCSVKENYEEELAVIESWLTKRKFTAIGEIGLDYHWDKTFIDQQKIAFVTQINFAKKYSLPIVIHQRESFDDLYEILQQMNDKLLKGIFHCFNGTVEQANKIIELGGFKLGIGGVVTYKNSILPEVLSHIDLQFLVLETDSPYLPPTPYRGKRNESSYITFVAEKLANIKKCSVEEIANTTTENAKKIFDLA